VEPDKHDEVLLEGVTRRQFFIVLFALMMGLAVSSLDNTVVATALPTIAGELGGVDKLSWIITASMLASTVSTPLYGKVSDIYGRRPLYLFAFGMFILGALLCSMAQTMGQLIACRAIQGIGGGGLMSLAFALIADLLPPRERSKYQGFTAAVFASSSFLGPLVGGLIVDSLSWRWIFIIDIPLALAAAVAMQAVLRTVPFRRTPHTVDYTGAVLIVITVSALLLTAVFCGRVGWDDPRTVGMAVTALVGFAITAKVESRAVEPILPPSLFQDRIISVCLVVALCFGFTLMGTMSFLPLYLQIGQGYSATSSGLLLATQMAGMLVSSIITGRLIARTGRYRAYPIVGSGVLLVAMAGLTQISSSTPIPLFLVGIITMGIAMGLTNQVLVLAAQNATGPSLTGVVTSAVQCIRSLGITFGTAVYGAVLATTLANGVRGLEAADGTALSSKDVLGAPSEVAKLPEPVREQLADSVGLGLAHIFWIAAPMALVTFVLSFLIRARPLRATRVAEEPADPQPAPA
jgi:EmrB/QacA subfamily drug resistance transporter